MKKTSETADDLLPEYDFAALTGGVRGKYAEQYRSGTNLARLDPDIRASFATDEAVNQALRAVLTAAAAIRSDRPRS